jgi:hypothetical protein
MFEGCKVSVAARTRIRRRPDCGRLRSLAAPMANESTVVDGLDDGEPIADARVRRARSYAYFA